MNTMDPDGATLVLVDYQQRLLPALHGHTAMLVQARRLAAVAQVLQLPIVGTEQNPAGLGPNVEPLRSACALTLPKRHFDACADGLLDALPGRGDVVIAGCEAHVCLLQTTLGLLRAGRRVWVVAQACGSRTADNHALAMQRLHHAGAGIVSVEMVAFEALRHCDHPRFKAVLALLKDEQPGHPDRAATGLPGT